MSDPQMAQWQQRFDAANAAVSAARTPQQKAAAYQRLREVQTARPNGPGKTAQGGRLRGQTAQPAQGSTTPSSGGLLGGVMSHIRNAMASSNKKQ